MVEPGVEDAVCGGWPEGEGPAQTHGAAKNGDDAMLLDATQKIALGVFKLLTQRCLQNRKATGHLSEGRRSYVGFRAFVSSSCTAIANRSFVSRAILLL